MQHDRPIHCRIQETTLFVRGIEIDALIGVYPSERITKQSLIIDLELLVKSAESDDIDKTFDYVQIPDIVACVARECHFNLIESFAERIGQYILTHDRVEQVAITIVKPEALRSSAACPGVRLTVSRPA